MKIPLSRYESLGSTSAYAQQLMVEGRKPPFAVQAQEQTHGLGQRGKSWTSPKGNLYLSIAIPNSSQELRARGLIPVKVACLLAKWLTSELRVHPVIKWPNDLYFQGKKLAGILCQSSVQANTWSTLLIGIGINVSHAPNISSSQYKSISLSEIVPAIPELDALASSLVNYIGAQWLNCSKDDVYSLYSYYSLCPFSFWQEERNKEQKVYWESGIDSDGCLCLQGFSSQKGRTQGNIKLASASHGLSNIFLSDSQTPLPIILYWNKALYISLFTNRFCLDPVAYHQLRLEREGFGVAAEKLSESLGGRSCSFNLEQVYPVVSYGLLDQKDMAFAEKFAAHGLVLLEARAKPRLSFGLGGSLPFQVLRLAAIESWLERERFNQENQSSAIIFDWSEVLGFADYFDAKGSFLDSLDQQRLEQILKSKQVPKVFSSMDLIRMVLHGLMLLAIG